MNLLLALILAAPPLAAEELTLRLSSARPLVYAGETASCLLSIEGPGVSAVVEDTPGVVPHPGIGFRYEFEVRGEKPGELEIGPYRVEFQGRRLVSNRLKIVVVPKQTTTEHSEIRLILSDDRVKLGESVNLLLEIPQIPAIFKTPDLRFDDALGALEAGRTSSVSMVKGKVAGLSAHSYVLIPKKKGRYVLSARTIKGLPDGAEFEEKILTVE